MASVLTKQVCLSSRAAMRAARDKLAHKMLHSVSAASSNRQDAVKSLVHSVVQTNSLLPSHTFWMSKHHAVAVPTRSMSSGFQKAPGQNQGELDTAGSDGPAPHEKMAIVFTCKTCEARVQRVFTKRSYERGVVIVRVEKEDGCNRKDGGDHCLHLIADNMGWFEDQPTNVEKLLAQRGEQVQRMVVRDSTQAEGAESGAGEEVVRERVLVKIDTGKTVELCEEEAEGGGDAPLLK